MRHLLKIVEGWVLTREPLGGRELTEDFTLLPDSIESGSGSYPKPPLPLQSQVQLR